MGKGPPRLKDSQPQLQGKGLKLHGVVAGPQAAALCEKWWGRAAEAFAMGQGWGMHAEGFSRVIRERWGEPQWFLGARSPASYSFQSPVRNAPELPLTPYYVTYSIPRQEV